MSLLHIVLFAAVCATSFAETANFQTCEEYTEGVCNVTGVRITPCKKPSQCVLKKRSNATISFDFTPNFAADELKTVVYWVSGGGDLLFEDFGSDNGCEYTTCPTEVGKPQTLNYSVYINKKMGTGIYPLKWKLWKKSDDTKICCFKLTIQIK